MQDPEQEAPSRRQTIIGLGSLVIGLPLTLNGALAVQVADGQKLKPGDFTWHPERSPSGQVAIVVSIPDQLVTVYRGGSVIAVSTCSTGKPGHSTPTGTFTILEKARVHHSSTYNNAPMPNMERLTWSGIALHAGKLPGYPASHGCIRLPMEFSALLFTVTHVGTTVTITSAHTVSPSVEYDVVASSGGGAAGTTVAAALQGATASSMRDKIRPPIPRPNPTPASVPSRAPAAAAPVLAVVVSSADQRMIVFDHDDIVAEGKAFITDPQTPLGSHVFVLDGSDGTGMTWHVMSFAAEPGGVIGEPDAQLLRRITAEIPVIDAMKQRMHPGMVLITTDDPMTPDTSTGEGFSIITSDARPMSQR